MKSYKIYLILFINTILVALSPITALKCANDDYHDIKICTIDSYQYSPSMNSISYEFDAVDNAASIEFLIFNNSIVTEPPPMLCKQLKNLGYLNISESQMYTLHPLSFAFCSNLGTVILTRNFIADLPEGTFTGADQLKTIDLSGNQIKQIRRKVFKNLSKLVMVDLSHNRLVMLSSKVFPLQLRQLDVSFNQLHSFSIKNLINIYKLNVNNNALRFLTLNSNIKEIQAANNLLQSSSIFYQIRELRSLELQNNLFSNFDAIKYITNLYHANFSSNPIQNINSNQSGSVISLDISSINLYDFTAIPRFDQLIYLRVNNNNLNSAAFKKLHIWFPTLKSIDISENNWDCLDLIKAIEIIDELHIANNIYGGNLNKLDTNIRGIRCSNDTYLNYSLEIANKKIDELQTIINKLLEQISRMCLIITVLGLSLGIILIILFFSVLCKNVYCNLNSKQSNYEVLI